MNCDDLLQLLKRCIAEKKAIIREYYKYEDSSLSEKKELEKLLFTSVENISTVSLEKLHDIIFSFPISASLKKELYEQLNTIIVMLKLNSINGTTLVLDDKQKNVLDKFIGYLHDYIVSRRDFCVNSNINIDEVVLINDKYKALATLLNNPKNTKFISDVSTLNTLFVENNITEEDKRKILISIIKYNKNIFNYKNSKNNMLSVSKYNGLESNKVNNIFKHYGYDYDVFTDREKYLILSYGNYNKIREVLDTMCKLSFPKTGEEISSYVLMSLVLASDGNTLMESMKLAISRKVSVKDLLMIPGVLIKNKKDDSCIFDGECIAGSFIDFKKNIYNLEKYGISIKEVFLRCPLILVCPSEVLSNNLESFLDYGFTFRNNKKALFDKTLPALISNNFLEIVDQFIEIHPYGISYLRSNLSCIRTVKDKDDVLFYKIYYSIIKQGINAAFITVISNNKNYLCLRNFSQDIYLDINDDNKMEITNTFRPSFIREEQYLKILDSNKDNVIDVFIFDNEYIQLINIFSDTVEPLIYNFKGIRISKIKVLRVFSILLRNGVDSNFDSFLFSVLYNTIISKEDYDKLVNIIKRSED